MKTLTVNTNSSPETSNTIYCAGCNARFQQVALDGVCPRCGARVARAVDEVPLAETLLLKDPTDKATDQTSPPATAAEELDQLIGKRLHVYRCESLLGCGGMGRVYLAHHTELGRKCALKILSPRLIAHDIDFVSRFLQEGRATAALNHPNIVTTHAIGEARGYHFLEMEFVAGRSLQRLIEDEGRLTAVRSTTLALEIAQGLAAAHQAGIAHRDLKPDNVLLTRRGIPKIADFGLAKRILPDQGTSAERLVGTPNFMAPELFRGRPTTPSSDVYALGVCYYLMLTGRLPFVCGSLEELKHTVSTDPLPNVRDDCPDVRLEMAECLSLLLAKAPENRPNDGIEASQLLLAVAGQMRDVESLLQEAFRNAGGVSWMRADSRYRLCLTLPDGRRQTLFVEPSDHTAAERLLLIYSVCCNAQPEYYEEALRLNSEIPHGGLSIREIDGEMKFVMVDTYPRATVDPEEIRRSALEVACRADAVEKLLTGRDEN